MTLRVGFDMDGVVADFASAFRDIECDLFGADTTDPAPNAPEEEKEQTPDRNPNPSVRTKESDRRRRAVWDRIRATPDFWTTLKPTDPVAVRQLYAQMLRCGWEVIFITQRPSTAGETVQRQTQRWLVQQGFDMPSVVVIAGSRGAAINALRLTHHVDDSPQNCVDVKTDSTAMPILIVRHPDDSVARQARKLGMSVAASIRECLDLLVHASDASGQSSVVRRLAALVNWSG
jgi:beta-phosphoglucomutase-like phosphatase (HAD superfamily)